MNPNGGAALDASLLSGGFHQNVNFLQVLEGLALRLQGVDASVHAPVTDEHAQVTIPKS